MYAERYSRPGGLNPGGVAFALGASGVLLFGLSLTAPHFVQHIVPTIEATNIPLPTDPPPPEHPKPQPPAALHRTMTPKPIDHVEVTDPPIPMTTSGLTGVNIDLPPMGGTASNTGETGTTGTIPLPPPPVLTAARIDSRYRDSFQPAYPADERLAEHEGRVVVRVLVGTDGRVKQVEAIIAASPAFLEATRRQALTRWRFTPATRDGVAVEAWQQMAVRFQLGQE
ncbi:TonB family protein [Sphingomonas sp. PAMC 26621]|uniref:TonB family protein n=1 Tax=Sphingomonas sp. PAMC 26621 TaxID=1112213 RepID=UPI000287ABAD|nr:TonB family protein [Sphingomonas sp. PAMC 26621]